MENTLTLIVQIIVGVGGIAGITSLFLVNGQKKKLVAESGKTNAEADQAFSDAYHRRAQTQISLLEPYEKVQAMMQREIDEQADEIRYLKECLDVVLAALYAGGVPVPAMPEKPKKVKNGSV